MDTRTTDFLRSLRGSVRLVFAERLRSRGSRGRDYPGRSHGEHNPKNDVSESTSPGTEERKNPNHPNDRGIKVEIVGQAGAHARNFLVGAGAHEFPFAACLRREAWRRSFRLFCAAVVAKLRADRDVFLAANASHWVTPTERF